MTFQYIFLNLFKKKSDLKLLQKSELAEWNKLELF